MPSATDPVGCGWNTGGGVVSFGCTGVLSGAPTCMSQRWPGSPWAGFSATLEDGEAALVAGALVAGVLTVLLVLFSFSEQAVKPSSAAASIRFAVVFMFRVRRV